MMNLFINHGYNHPHRQNMTYDLFKGMETLLEFYGVDLELVK